VERLNFNIFEDSESEPVVDGSRNRWRAVQWATETNERYQQN